MQSPRSLLDSTGQCSAEILLLAPAKVCREGTQVSAQEPQAHSCILCPAPCWLAEGLEEPTDSGCVTPTFCLHLTLPQHIRNLHRPPPAPQLTLARLDEEPRTLFPCSSKISAQYSYLRNDTAAPQKCKISISWASHSNCLLRKNHIRWICIPGSICVLLSEGRQAAFRKGKRETRMVSCGTNLICNIRWNVAGVAWSPHSRAPLVFTVQSPRVCKIVAVSHKGPCV